MASPLVSLPRRLAQRRCQLLARSRQFLQKFRLVSLKQSFRMTLSLLVEDLLSLMRTVSRKHTSTTSNWLGEVLTDSCPYGSPPTNQESALSYIGDSPVASQLKWDSAVLSVFIRDRWPLLSEDYNAKSQIRSELLLGMQAMSPKSLMNSSPVNISL